MALLDATTRERVKRAAGYQDPTTADSNEDTYLDALIDSVSLAFDRFIGGSTPSGSTSRLLQESRTEVFDLPRWRNFLWLPAYPISSITSVKQRSSISTAFSDVTAIDSSNYEAVTDTGKLNFTFNLFAGEQTVQVVYVGGLATSTANLITNYPDVVDAADKQIVYELKRRDALGPGSIAVQGSTFVSQAGVKLLPSVTERLWPYVRIRLGV